MLHLKKLLLFVVVALTPAALSCADKTAPARFFNGPVKFFEEAHTDKGCKNCPDEVENDTSAPDSLTARQLDSKTVIKPSALLYVFVVPSSKYSLPAVSAAKSFSIRHPEVAVRGVVLAPITGLQESLKNSTALFDKTFTFDFDPLFDLAKKYGVSETPSFVFVKGAKIWRVSGQPELEQIFRQLR